MQLHVANSDAFGRGVAGKQSNRAAGIFTWSVPPIGGAGAVASCLLGCVPTAHEWR